MKHLFWRKTLFKALLSVKIENNLLNVQNFTWYFPTVSNELLLMLFNLLYKKKKEILLYSHGALFRHHFLAGSFCWWVKSCRSSRSVWESVCSHVFPVSFADDAEGSRVSIGYVGDGVSVQCNLMCDGTNLLDGQLRARLPLVGKGHLKSFVIAERDISTGAQASCGMLGKRGGILLCGLRNILIQPWENR